MLKLFQIIFVFLSFFMLISCESDETIDRDDLKLKAVYQEYNVTYFEDRSEIYSEVFFRTSSAGSYVKLGDDDVLYMKAEKSDWDSFREMKRRKKQIYFGSKNVPYHKAEFEINKKENNKITWEWYDSETGKDLITETTILDNKIVDISNGGDDQILNSIDEKFYLKLEKKLKDNQSLQIRFINVDTESRPSYSLSVDVTDFNDENDLLLELSTDQLREMLKGENKIVKEKKAKKFGNLKLKVKTQKSVPVLSEEKQSFDIEIKLIEEDYDLDNGSGKSGTLINTYVYTVHNLDIEL